MLKKIPSILPAYCFLKRKINMSRLLLTKDTKYCNQSSSITDDTTFNIPEDISTTGVVGSRLGSKLSTAQDHEFESPWVENWTNEISKVCSSFPVSETSEDVKQAKTVWFDYDKLQMLPFWLNENIISYLDQKTRADFKKVNDYWSYLVDEVKKEEDNRINLNKLITKLHCQYSDDQPVEPQKKIKEVKQPKSKKKELQPVEIEKEPIIESNVTFEERKQILHRFNQSTLSGRYNLSVLTDRFEPNRYTACSANNNMLLSTGRSHNILIYSLVTGCQLTTKLSGHTGSITCLAMNPDGSRLISGSVDATVRCWDFKRRSLERIYYGHTKPITSVAANKTYVVSASQEKHLKVHNLLNGLLMWTLEDQQVLTTLFLMEDNKFYSGSLNGITKKYNILKKQITFVFAAQHIGEVTCLLVTPYLVLSSGFDGFVHCLNRNDPQNETVPSCNNRSPVKTMTLFDSEYVLCGCENGRVNIWHFQSCTLLRVIKPSADLRSVKNIHVNDRNGEIKLIINLDTSISSFEFIQSHPTPKKQFPIWSGIRTGKSKTPITSLKGLSSCCRDTGIDPENDDEGKAVEYRSQMTSMKDERMRKLEQRCCTLPNIRNKHAYTAKASCILLSALSKNPRTEKGVRTLVVCPRYETRHQEKKVFSKPTH